MPRYPVTMEVKEIRDQPLPMCPVHKVGDKIVIDNGCLEGKICLPVLSQQIARLYGLVNGVASAKGCGTCGDVCPVLLYYSSDIY